MAAKSKAKSDEEREEIEQKLKELAHYSVDLEALHRHVAANNRRMVKEGILPPGALNR